MKSAWIAVFLTLGAASALAGPPPWVSEAIASFRTEIPPGVGYVVEVTRNQDRSVERFDPSRPPGGRWSLLSRAGRPPTTEELTAYARQRGAGAAESPAFRAAFRPEQVDLASARVLEDGEQESTVRLGFTSAAVDADKMLGRLELTLRVRKHPATVLEYRLRLPASYSPVLGVRMHDLDAGATFDDDGLPRRSWSYFRGRIFLRTVDERIDATYRDYSGPVSGPR